MVLGTLGYMSPEQAAGRTVDFRSDQFSFGTIVYEMASGKRAFHRATGPETLTAILREEPEPLLSAASLSTPKPNHHDHQVSRRVKAVNNTDGSVSFRAVTCKLPASQ